MTNEDPKICLKDIISFKGMTFKDRDEMVEILSTWKSKNEFKMEEYRDQRLRYLWKTRYDYRKNMADFNYHFKLKEVAPIIRF